MKFRVERVEWRASRARLAEIRIEVFVREQGVALEDEWDRWDQDSRHWLVYPLDGPDLNKPIGTARLSPNGQIGRMAILKQYRGEGAGYQLLLTVIDDAKLSFDQLFLHAQTHAIDFYRRAGFRTVGAQFDEAGIAHQKMILKLVVART